VAAVTGERIGIPIVIQPKDRDRLAGDLQQAVVDLTSLSLDGKQAHWHVTGEHFMSVHQQLDRIVEDTRRWTDQIAERAVTLGVNVDGRAQTIAESATASSMPTGWIRDRDAVGIMADQIEAVVARLRRWLDVAEADLATQDLIMDVLRGLEMHLWMLQAQRA
jgi:starvation-inducible DNA-binding protein